MQTSGSCPQFSDGVRKTVTTKAPSKAPAVARVKAPKMASPATPAHRAGGYAKHTRRGSK